MNLSSILISNINIMEEPIIKHQHGHRTQITWWWDSFKTRKHMSHFVPDHHWNKKNPSNDGRIKEIYVFKSQDKWSVHRQHKSRIKKRRMIARDTKYFVIN